MFVTGCTNTNAPEEKGEKIITAGEALKSLSDEGVVLVDAQNASVYEKNHIEGAVNISRSNITTLDLFPNMLSSAEDIEAVLSESGIADDSTVFVYDNTNNMDSAR